MEKNTLVELLNLANEKVKEDVIELSAEKFERRLTEEIAKLDNKISDVKVDLIKLQVKMFIFK
jgi:hypothetical protein